jgi:hypothetical protein
MQVQSHAEHEFIGPLVPRAEPARKLDQSDKRSMTALHVGAAFWIVGFAVGFVFWQYVGFWAVIQSVFYPGNGSGQERSATERTGRKEPSSVSAAVQTSGTPSAVGLLSVRLGDRD